jgi:hypothetical protein
MIRRSSGGSTRAKAKFPYKTVTASSTTAAISRACSKKRCAISDWNAFAAARAARARSDGRLPRRRDLEPYHRASASRRIPRHSTGPSLPGSATARSHCAHRAPKTMAGPRNDVRRRSYRAFSDPDGKKVRLRTRAGFLHGPNPTGGSRSLLGIGSAMYSAAQRS